MVQIEKTAVNVGTIDGGMRPNVIAPESRAEVDVRVRTQQDAERIERAIHSIQPTDEWASASVSSNSSAFSAAWRALTMNSPGR